MKLLFDQNLAPSLVSRLVDLYPESEHVYLVGLDRASDEAVWDYARDNDYLIVTRDTDFSELSVVRGSPPKVLWVRIGNCTTGQIEALLRAHHAAIEAFNDDAGSRVLMLL